MALKRYLAVGEIAVGAGIVILSVGILPFWSAIIGLAFFAMGIGGLPWTSQMLGSDNGPQVGGRIAGLLLILGFIAWLALPEQGRKTAKDVTLSAMPAPPPDKVAATGASQIAPTSVSSHASTSATPPSTPVDVPTVASQPSPTGASKSTDAPLAELSARHKHRFRDCEGVLTFSVNAIRFRTDHPYDSFVFAIDQVEVDNDGLRDHFGKAWHFTAEGHDMEDMFKRWKAGALRAQNTTK